MRTLAAALLTLMLSVLSSGGPRAPSTADGAAISARIAQQAQDEDFDFTTWCECMNGPAPAAAPPAAS